MRQGLSSAWWWLAASGCAWAQPAAWMPEHDCGGVCGKAALLRLRAAQGLPIVDPAPLVQQAEDAGATDVRHVKLELEILPASTSLNGVCTTTIRSTQDGLTQFTFRLRSQFAITSATVSGMPVTVTGLDTTTRRVTLDRTYNAGEEFTLVIAYNGQAMSRGFGSITFTTQGGATLVSTLSEPYFAYTWWPAKDGAFGQPGDNTDKFTTEFWITTPGGLTAVSNGLRQGIDTLAGGRLRHRWKTDYPMSTYLAAFSATNYNAWTRTYTYPGGTMPVQFFIYPGSDTPGNRAAWEVVLPAMEVFRPIYGLYPFINEAYGIYQFPFSGGMEHQTMTGQGTFNESVTIHELAHQWWGDDVTCATWSDIWINEGNATYGEALWLERRPGSSGAAALRQAMQDRRPADPSGSVWVPAAETADPNRIFDYPLSYQKGAWVLHMLRRALGDEAFFEAQRAVRAEWSGRALRTDQYRDTLAQSAGRDLTTFFDQWVYGRGAPSYAFGVQPLLVNGRHYARVHVRQTQDPAFGAAGKFVMPLDVRVTTGAGPRSFTVQNDEGLEWFVRPIDAAATGVTLDPDDWVLATGRVVEAAPPAPPVVVEVQPAPASVTPVAAAPSAVTVYFSDAVSVSAAHVTLRRGGVVEPMQFAYSPADRRVTLTRAGGPLPAGAYELTVSDAVTGPGLALDGEAAGGLPSGDGRPGGSATILFSVAPSPRCPADFDDDGTVNQEDLGGFITAWLAEPVVPGPGGFAVSPCVGEPAPFDVLGYQADFDRDCAFTQEDLGGYIVAYFETCG